MFQKTPLILTPMNSSYAETVLGGRVVEAVEEVVVEDVEVPEESEGRFILVRRPIGRLEQSAFHIDSVSVIEGELLGTVTVTGSTVED